MYKRWYGYIMEIGKVCGGDFPDFHVTDDMAIYMCVI